MAWSCIFSVNKENQVNLGYKEIFLGDWDRDLRCGFSEVDEREDDGEEYDEQGAQEQGNHHPLRLIMFNLNIFLMGR